MFGCGVGVLKTCLRTACGRAECCWCSQCSCRHRGLGPASCLPPAGPHSHQRWQSRSTVFLHSFANKFFFQRSFLLSLNFKSSTEYISIAVVTYETMILSTICSRYYNQLQSVRLSIYVVLFAATRISQSDYPRFRTRDGRLVSFRARL